MNIENPGPLDEGVNEKAILKEKLASLLEQVDDVKKKLEDIQQEEPDRFERIKYLINVTINTTANFVMSAEIAIGFVRFLNFANQEVGFFKEEFSDFLSKISQVLSEDGGDNYFANVIQIYALIWVVANIIKYKRLNSKKDLID